MLAKSLSCSSKMSLAEKSDWTPPLLWWDKNRSYKPSYSWHEELLHKCYKLWSLSNGWTNSTINIAQIVLSWSWLSWSTCLVQVRWKNGRGQGGSACLNLLGGKSLKLKSDQSGSKVQKNSNSQAAGTKAHHSNWQSKSFDPKRP